MEFEGLAGGKRSHTTLHLVTMSYQTQTMEFKGHLISSPIISYHVTAKLLGFLLLQLLQLSNNTETHGLCVLMNNLEPECQIVSTLKPPTPAVGVQLCNYATMQLCNCATVQLCNCATMQLCNCAAVLL